MKISICQINPVIGDLKYNSDLIKKGCEKALDNGSSLAIFPELSLTGYPPKDLLEKPAFIQDNLAQLEYLSSHVKNINILIGYVEKNPSSTGMRLINGVALISNGEVLKKGGKRLLPAYDVFDETRYFEPSKESLVFELENSRIGVTICEDIWNLGNIRGVPQYLEDPVADLIKRKIDIHINLSASPYSLNKESIRCAILEKLSNRHKIPTVLCNQVGGNDELLFDGSSMVVDKHGKLILLGKNFESDTIVWDTEKRYSKIEDPWPEEVESVFKGLVMGVQDYVSKCGFQKVLIGLSGGIDSTLVAAIACKALGPENVQGISMPSPFTSNMSKEDARKLAENLNMHFQEIPINNIFESYKKTLSDPFKGLEEDVTEENIQARIRGNILMALSNKFNALLLTTGNKSEMATGYCTLYGDMSGGLAVIADIPKTLCYRLAKYINRTKELIPERIITRPPSAELRPDQTDQDTLPPYSELDDIVEAAIEKNLSFSEIVAQGHDRDTVKDILNRIMYNEHKRRQAPPGLKITSKAFGYGRRYPIARGGKPY